MKITVICPIYNGEKYIENINLAIKKQEKISEVEIKYLLTESKDNSEDILKRINASYTKVSFKEFSHSLTREKAAYEAKGDIIVFITQDIKIIEIGRTHV